MIRTTWLFAVALLLLGIAFFVATGHAHPTALIPCALGLLLALCAALADTEDARRRMLWMHIAVTVGLLGLVAALARAVPALLRAGGAGLAHPAAAYEQLAMGALCLLFVLLCVRSFVAARRGRAG